jgi:carboxyl-terminal processing protease
MSPLRRFTRSLLAVLPLALAACSGGDGGDEAPAAECSVRARNDWLASYMNEWYFWYKVSPTPSPADFSSTEAYFAALLYTGGSAGFPRDRWSGSQSTEAYNRFFGDGKTLGYGVSVAGLEVTGQPSMPLYVRHVEPQSDAAAKGIRRGDQVLSLNGRAVSEIIAANDFSALTAANAGDMLTLRLLNAGVERSVSLVATVFSLTPMQQAQVLTLASGRRLGYIVVKDMVSQVMAPLEAAFAEFKAQGVQDLVLDLRYNGGGLVQIGTNVASHVTGIDARGQVFASLLYNDKRASANNANFLFSNPSGALGLRRVYVLAGERTCSASEQVVNGLRPFVDVVLIGDTTCGKPVGFLPVSQCGTTYSVVNFESVNARNEGRYFDGLNPTCAVAEDFTRGLGATDEPLLAAARRHVDSGSCFVAGSEREQGMARQRTTGRVAGPGLFQGTILH